MIITGGSIDVTTHFSMRLATTGLEAIGLTIADFDMQYVRTRTIPVAKVDAEALAATDAAHTDNRGIEIDATDQSGLYRFDWPDAAFAAGVKEVILSIKHTSCLTEHLRVEIDVVPTVAANATELLDVAAGVETGRTVRQSLRLMLAALCGKASGMGTATGILRDTNDTKDRVTATIDADGNRSAVTLDAS